MTQEAIILSLLREHLRVRRYFMRRAPYLHMDVAARGSHEWHMNRASIRAGIARLRQVRAGEKPTATVKDFIAWRVPLPAELGGAKGD